MWPHTLGLQDVVHPWIPAPLLALRTLKGEIALGRAEGQAEAASHKDPEWMVAGKFGQVQYVPKKSQVIEQN